MLSVVSTILNPVVGYHHRNDVKGWCAARLSAPPVENIYQDPALAVSSCVCFGVVKVHLHFILACHTLWLFCLASSDRVVCLPCRSICSLLVYG
jgi:hypothetical protein